MPTSRELVSNKALSGTELAQIILADTQRMLDGNGLLSGHMAFSRITYDLRLTLHLDLPTMPDSVDHATSRPVATADAIAHPYLGAIESGPALIDPSPDAILHATGLTREIASPNLARVEHGLPVIVDVQQQDGHSREELVTYKPVDVGMKAADFAQPDLTDLSPEVRRELGL